MKRLAAVSIAVALLAVGFWVEKRASTCGAGVVQRGLPYGLQADWFNGGVWLVDAEGWGVVAPPGDLNLSSGEVIEIERLEGYASKPDFIVEVILRGGDRALITFAGSTHALLRPHLVDSSQIGGVDALQDEPSWTSLDPRSCLYGRFAAARALIGAGLAWVVVVGWRARPRKR